VNNTGYCGLLDSCGRELGYGFTIEEMLEFKINRVNDKTKAKRLARWEHLLFALNG